MDTSLTDLHIYKMTTRDEALSGKARTKVRFTGESFKASYQKKASDEIRADGNVPDLTMLSASQGGGFNFEFAAADASGDTLLDNLIASILGKTSWTSGAAFSEANETVTIATGVVTPTTGDPADLILGHYVYMSGFSSTYDANNGFFKVIAKDASTFTLSPAPVDCTGQTGITIKQTDMISNLGGAMPVDSLLYAVERSHVVPGPSTIYFGLKNCVPTRLSLNFPTDAEITGSIDFMGGEELAPGTSSNFGAGSITPANTNPVMNATFNVATLVENGVEVSSLYIQSASIDITRNPRLIRSIGSQWGRTLGFGRWNVTGSISALFTDKDWYDRMRLNTSTNLAIAVKDANGKGYVFSIPAVKFLDHDMPTGGNDADLIQTVQFQGILATDVDSINKCIQIDRIK